MHLQLHYFVGTATQPAQQNMFNMWHMKRSIRTFNHLVWEIEVSWSILHSLWVHHWSDVFLTVEFVPDLKWTHTLLWTAHFNQMKSMNLLYWSDVIILIIMYTRRDDSNTWSASASSYLFITFFPVCKWMLTTIQELQIQAYWRSPVSRSIRNVHVQQETWRIGGVSTVFLMSDLVETFTEGFDVFSLPSDTISRSIKMSMSENADSSFWKVSWFIRNVQEETWVIKQNYTFI